MEIKLQEENDALVLSDENLDNDNFVTVRFGRAGNTEPMMDVNLDELVAAALAFVQKRNLYKQKFPIHTVTPQ